MKERPCFYQPFLSILSHGYIARFWNSNQTVRFDRENLEPLIFAVLLVSGTAIWEKKDTRANRGWTSRFLWFLFFSKYWLKLKIWPACTLDFFQIWNQKIYERKKENKLRRRRWQSRGCAKLTQQTSNPAQIASHGLHLHLLLLFLLLTSFSPSSLSSFHLHCCGFRFLPSLRLCLCCFFWILFYVSKALSHDLHWVRRKLLIFELKVAKCFSH